MSEYHFSKSRHCSCIQCPKILWLREHLLRYCELDTFAMVKVLEKLEEVVE